MMVDAGQVVLKLHQQASTLADCALLTKHNELVAAARKLARTINQLVIADRPLSQALLTLYSKDHQPSAQWTVKLGTLTALLCHQLGYLESVSETLVRAAITMDLSVIDTLNARFKSQPLSNDMKQRWLKHPILSAQLLKRSGVQDPLWLTLVLQHHESPNGKGYPNSLPQSQLLSSSILLGFASDSLELLMPTAKRHGILPDTVLQRCYFRRGCYLKAHIQALADIFSPLATGTQLKLQGGGLAIVLRKPVKDYVWAALPISRPQQKAADVVKLEKPEVDRVFPMLKIGSPNTLSTWLDGHQQMSNSQKYCWLDPTPQPSPLKIQLNRLLSEDQPNITKISQYIASEPLLIDALTEMANRQTKTAKATKEIKHAIMMMGLDRLGPILMRTDLLQQCMQRRFPLDRWAYQYINLYAECCAQLASQSYFMFPVQA